jgi:predicted RNase H-like HicB family nuclease
MLTRYIHEAMKRARYKTLENGDYFGQIPGLAGVWANARTLGKCRTEFQEVLEEWLVLKIRDNDPIPRIGPGRVAAKGRLTDGARDYQTRADPFVVLGLRVRFQAGGINS